MVLNEAINSWQKSLIELNSGASSKEIIALENKLQFSFPRSFVSLYQMADGFKDGDTDENLFSIWPLARISKEYTVSTNKAFIGFCDWSINCHFIGFVRDRSAIYKDYNLCYPVASTFEEVIELMLAGSNLLY